MPYPENSPFLLAGRHDPTDLAILLIGNAQNYRNNGGSLTDSQRKAVERYTRFVKDHDQEHFLELESDGHQIQKGLEELFEIFDGLFFFGKLNLGCPVSLVPHIRGASAATRCQISSTFRNGYEPFAEIEIVFISKSNLEYFQKQHPGSNLWQHYASKLVHEMCHAFIWRYSHTWIIPTEELENVGVTGHGFVWMDIAHAIETATGHLPSASNSSKGLHVGIERSIAVELLYWDLPEIDPARWGLTAEDFAPACKCAHHWTCTIAVSSLKKPLPIAERVYEAYPQIPCAEKTVPEATGILQTENEERAAIANDGDAQDEKKKEISTGLSSIATPPSISTPPPIASPPSIAIPRSIAILPSKPVITVLAPAPLPSADTT